MIKREKYIKPIREFYDSDLIKVITGIRRCGKSVILQSIIDEIKEKTDNIIYLNFEKSDDFDKAPNGKDLIKYVKENKKNGICYCFFDEIQEVESWDKAIKDLRLDNCSIFITGSNSKLLSGEFLTLLSGRFISFRIRPFVYKEIIEYSKELNKEINIEDYLIWGGFPKRFETNSEEANKTYLSELENTIVINDLIKRYKIKNEAPFKKIVNYILVSNSRIFSLRSIYNSIKTSYPNIALSTIARYIEHLKEAFIIDEIPQYSNKAKKELEFYGKLYDADVCFNSLRVSNNMYDIDHNLENIVYNELIYMGYNLKVFRYNNNEIDFIANKGNRTFLIQVSYTVSNIKTFERETKIFNELDNTYQKILITNDFIDYSTSNIRHIKFKDFLVLEDL